MLVIDANDGGKEYMWPILTSLLRIRSQPQTVWE